MDVNHRSNKTFKGYMGATPEADYAFQAEYQPLMMETLAFDLAFLEYAYNETVFRYAIHFYQLQKDPEVKECLDEYLSN